MDRTDLRLIRAMGLRPFETWPREPDRFRPGYLAEAAGVSPETVKERLAKLARDGVLVGYEIYPNVRHLGLHQTTFHLRLPDAGKASAQDRLDPIDGLVGLYDFVGPDLCVDLCYRDEADLQRKLRLVSTLTGQEEVVRFYERALPEPKEPLSGLDWRIIQALRGNARRAPEEVAEIVGVSTKTVRRHHAAMAERGSVDTVAVVDLGKIPGLVIFNLVLHFSDPHDKDAIRAALHVLDEHFLYAWQPPSHRFGSYHVTAFAHNNAEVEDLRRKAGALSGVERVEVMIPCGARYHGEWLDEAIAAQLTAATLAKR